MMHDYSTSTRKDFYRFALGFVGMIAFGFAVLVVIGAYQVEINGSKNVSAPGTGVTDASYSP